MSEAIARWARRELNLELPRDGFRLEALPPHLQMNLRVLDEHGRQLGFGRNLEQLRSEGLTLMIVEQKLDIALAFASRAYVMVKGRIALHETCANLAQRSDLTDLYFSLADGRG